MKKYILFFVVIFFSISSAYALEKPLVDPEFEKVDQAIEKHWKYCRKKEKNPAKYMACGEASWDKFREEGKIRGTEEYCEFNYSKLGFDELIKLKKKFKFQQKTARDSYCVFFDGDKLPGEVTKQDLQTEMGWIQDRIADIHRKKMDAIERSLYQAQPASGAQAAGK